MSGMEFFYRFEFEDYFVFHDKGIGDVVPSDLIRPDLQEFTGSFLFVFITFQMKVMKNNLALPERVLKRVTRIKAPCD